MGKFGDLLQYYRRQSTDPEWGGILTQKKLAELVKEQLGIYVGISGATVSNWEKSKHSISKDDNALLVALIKVLHLNGGIESLGEANDFLKSGNYRSLNPEEIRKVNPEWLSGEAEPAEGSDEAKSGLAFTGRAATLIPPGTQRIESPPFMTPLLPPQGVIGREEMLEKILDLLAWEDAEATEVPPVALRGMGGIGKTTLATAIGRIKGVAGRFPGGVLWVALGPDPTVRFLLDGWGRALGVDLLPERDEEACRERLRAVFFHRQALLIIDDVWDLNHGKYFDVGGPHCRTLITTRESPIAFNLATADRTLRVDVLKPEAALELLGKLAPAAVAEDKANAQRLCERLEYLPLAIRLAGQFLAAEAEVPSRLGRLVDELIERREARLQLTQEEGRLGIDEDRPVSLQAILGLSVDRLNPQEKERFAMLGVFGGEPLTWEVNAVAHVWECKVEQAEVTISTFVKRGLVEGREGGRYWTHALLADYAEELLEAMGL